MSIIEVTGVSKVFKIRARYENPIRTLVSREYRLCTAVDNVTFSIEEGQAVGFIGPNGAGKSTTIKMITGILAPTLGKVRVLGCSPSVDRKEVSKHIGVVFGQRSQLWWDLPVRDSFQLIARMYKVSNVEFNKRVSIFNDVFSLNEFWEQPVRQLSLGQKMRAEFSASLLHNPKILLLDEPTIGLDVVVKRDIRKFIKAVQAEEKTTIILTTHDMRDIDEICDQVIMINNGKIVLHEGLKEMKGRIGGLQHMKVVFEKPVHSLVLQGCTAMQQTETTWDITFNHNEITPNAILAEITALYTVIDMNIQDWDTEDIIRDIYTDTRREIRPANKSQVED